MFSSIVIKGVRTKLFFSHVLGGQKERGKRSEKNLCVLIFYQGVLISLKDSNWIARLE